MIFQSDTVTMQSKGCNRVEKTRRQSSKTAVAKGRLMFDLFDFANVFSIFCKLLSDILIDTQVD